MKSTAALTLVLLAVTCAYGGVSTAYFCGYDDFSEVERAALTDSRDPGAIFRTTHFDTPKYRPLNRLAVLITYRLGAGSALLFRIRNLFFHLLAVAMLFGICTVLFHSLPIAAGAALLFGLHPLANQSVVAASWTNTMACAFSLMWFFFFLKSLRSRGAGTAWLAGSFAAALIALFSYEASLVFFGLIYCWLAVEAVRAGKLMVHGRRYSVCLLAGTAIVCGIFFAARELVVHSQAPMVPVAAVLKNAAVYFSALFMPVDLVFAHTLFGTPLASGLLANRTAAIIAATAALVLVAAIAVAIFSVRTLRIRLLNLDWWSIGCCLAAIPVVMAPFLLFNEHASETYLYLPAALFSLALCLALRGWFRGIRTYAMAIGAIALLFGAATLVRSSRVVACGAIARRILTELPTGGWRHGARTIRFASVPGEHYPERFGIYGYAGLGTIDPDDPAYPRPITAALQLTTMNPDIRGDIVSSSHPMDGCSDRSPCYWVHSDGRVDTGPMPGTPAVVTEAR